MTTQKIDDAVGVIPLLFGAFDHQRGARALYVSRPLGHYHYPSVDFYSGKYRNPRVSRKAIGVINKVTTALGKNIEDIWDSPTLAEFLGVFSNVEKSMVEKLTGDRSEITSRLTNVRMLILEQFGTFLKYPNADTLSARLRAIIRENFDRELESLKKLPIDGVDVWRQNDGFNELEEFEQFVERLKTSEPAIRSKVLSQETKQFDIIVQTISGVRAYFDALQAGISANQDLKKEISAEISKKLRENPSTALAVQQLLPQRLGKFTRSVLQDRIELFLGNVVSYLTLVNGSNYQENIKLAEKIVYFVSIAAASKFLQRIVNDEQSDLPADFWTNPLPDHNTAEIKAVHAAVKMRTDLASNLTTLFQAGSANSAHVWVPSDKEALQSYIVSQVFEGTFVPGLKSHPRLERLSCTSIFEKTSERFRPLDSSLFEQKLATVARGSSDSSINPIDEITVAATSKLRSYVAGGIDIVKIVCNLLHTGLAQNPAFAATFLFKDATARAATGKAYLCDIESPLNVTEKTAVANYNFKAGITGTKATELSAAEDTVSSLVLKQRPPIAPHTAPKPQVAKPVEKPQKTPPPKKEQKSNKKNPGGKNNGKNRV